MLSLAAVLGLAAPVHAVDLLTNGNLDAPQPAPWVEDSGGLPFFLIVDSGTSPIVPHTGTKLAWLGGVNIVGMSLQQDVAIPGWATTVIFSMFYQIGTQEIEPVAYDLLRAELRSTAGALLETLGQWDNIDATSVWTLFSAPVIGNYAGQTIRLRLSSLHDALFVTNFFIDTVVLDGSGPIGVAGGPFASVRVSPAAPNPTRSATSLRLELPSRATVRAGIYDVAGRRLRGIAEEFLDAGVHVLSWDGKDGRSAAAAPGVYVWRVEIDGRPFTRTIAIVR